MKNIVKVLILFCFVLWTEFIGAAGYRKLVNDNPQKDSSPQSYVFNEGKITNDVEVFDPTGGKINVPPESKDNGDDMPNSNGEKSDAGKQDNPIEPTENDLIIKEITGLCPCAAGGSGEQSPKIDEKEDQDNNDNDAIGEKNRDGSEDIEAGQPSSEVDEISGKNIDTTTSEMNNDATNGNRSTMKENEAQKKVDVNGGNVVSPGVQGFTFSPLDY